MFKTGLFLGFTPDVNYLEAYEKAPLILKSSFVNKNSDYLSKVSWEGNIIFGKFLGSTTHLSHVELYQANILSLLKKIVPDYPYSVSQFQLFTFYDQQPL